MDAKQDADAHFVPQYKVSENRGERSQRQWRRVQEETGLGWVSDSDLLGGKNRDKGMRRRDETQLK
jgi:hypothetical protein